jgi:hypothetical protein
MMALLRLKSKRSERRQKQGEPGKFQVLFALAVQPADAFTCRHSPAMGDVELTLV